MSRRTPCRSYSAASHPSCRLPPCLTQHGKQKAKKASKKSKDSGKASAASPAVGGGNGKNNTQQDGGGSNNGRSLPELSDQQRRELEAKRQEEEEAARQRRKKLWELQRPALVRCSICFVPRPVRGTRQKVETTSVSRGDQNGKIIQSLRVGSSQKLGEGVFY